MHPFFLKKPATTTMTTPSNESPFMLVTSPSVSRKETQRWQHFMNRFGIPYKTQVNNNNTSGVHVRFGSERYSNMYAALERWTEMTPLTSPSSIFSNSSNNKKSLTQSATMEEEDATSVTSSCFSSSLGLADSSDRSRSLRRSTTTSLARCLEVDEEEQDDDSSNKGDDHDNTKDNQNGHLLDRTFHCDNGELSKTSHRRSTLTTATTTSPFPRDQDNVSSSWKDEDSSDDDMDSMYVSDNSKEDCDSHQDDDDSYSDDSSTIDGELEFFADYARDTDKEVANGVDSCQGEEMEVEDLVRDAKNKVLNFEGSDRWSDDGMDSSDDAPKLPMPMPPLIPVDRSNTPTHFLGQRYSHQGLLDDVGSMHSQSTEGSLCNEDLLEPSFSSKPRSSFTSSSEGGNRHKRPSAMKHPGDSCSTWSTWASPCEDIQADFSFQSGLALTSLDDMSSHHLRPKTSSHGGKHRHPIPQHGSSSSLKYPLPNDLVDGFSHTKPHRLLENRLGSLRDRFTDEAGADGSKEAAGKDSVPSVPRRYSEAGEESSSDYDSDEEDEDEFAHENASNHSSKGSVDDSPGCWQPYHVSFQEGPTLSDEATPRTTMSLGNNTDTAKATGDGAMDMSNKSYDQPPSFPSRLPSGESPPRPPTTTEISSSPPPRLVVALSPEVSQDAEVHVHPLVLSPAQPVRQENAHDVVESSKQETVLGEDQSILQTSDLLQEPNFLLKNLDPTVHSTQPALISPGTSPAKIPTRNENADHSDCSDPSDCSGSIKATPTLLESTPSSPSCSSQRELNSRRAIVSSDVSPVAPVRNTSDHGHVSTSNENDEFQGTPLKAASKKLAMRRSKTGEDLPGLVAFSAATSVPSCIGTAGSEYAKENFSEYQVDAPAVASHGVLPRTTDKEVAPLQPSLTWKRTDALMTSKTNDNHHEALASFRKRRRGYAILSEDQQASARNLSATQREPLPASPTINVAAQALGTTDFISSKTPTQEAVVAVVTPCAPHKKQPRRPLSEELDEDVSHANSESPSQQIRPNLNRAFSWSSMKLLACHHAVTPDSKTAAEADIDIAIPNEVDIGCVPHRTEASSTASSSTEKTRNLRSVVARLEFDGMISLPNGKAVSSVALTTSLMDYLPRRKSKTSGRPYLYFRGSEGITTFRKLFFEDDTDEGTIAAFGRSLEGESGIIINLTREQTDYRRCVLILQPNWQLHVHNTFVKWPNNPGDRWIMQLPHGKTALRPAGSRDPTQVVLYLSQLMDQIFQRSSNSLDRELFRGFEAASCELQVIELTHNSFGSVGARIAFQLNLFNLMVRHALILKYDEAKGLPKLDWPKRQSELAPFLASVISYKIGGEIYSALDVHNALLEGTGIVPGSVPLPATKPSRWNWSCCGSEAVAHSVDPTVLMSMTFGTASSPEITAADPAKFEIYLQDAAKCFCRDHIDVRVGAFKTCTIQMPELFKWHRETFTGGAGATPESIVKNILPYLPTEQFQALTENNRKWKIRYVKHDWKPRQLSHRTTTTSVLANCNADDPKVSLSMRDLPPILEETRDSSSRPPQTPKRVRAMRLTHQSSPIDQPAKPKIAAYSHLDVFAPSKGDRGDDGVSILSDLTTDLLDFRARRDPSSQNWRSEQTATVIRNGWTDVMV